MDAKESEQGIPQAGSDSNLLIRREHLIHTLQSKSSNLPTIDLSIRKPQAFLDSFRILHSKSAEELKSSNLSIRFQGIPQQRPALFSEWLTAACEQMLDPNLALFIPSSQDSAKVHLSSLSSINQQHLGCLRFAGRVIGIAVREAQSMMCRFSRIILRELLGLDRMPDAEVLEEMKEFDGERYNLLTGILKGNVENKDLFFTVVVERFGVEDTVELVHGGCDLFVTEENKLEYVQLVAEYIMVGCIRPQLNNLVAGFHDIVPVELLKQFTEEEIDQLISG